MEPYERIRTHWFGFFYWTRCWSSSLSSLSSPSAVDRYSYFRKRGPYPVPPPTARESVVPDPVNRGPAANTGTEAGGETSLRVVPNPYLRTSPRPRNLGRVDGGLIVESSLPLLLVESSSLTLTLTGLIVESSAGSPLGIYLCSKGRVIKSDSS